MALTPGSKVDSKALNSFVNQNCNSTEFNETVKAIWDDQKIKCPDGIFSTERLKEVLSGFRIRISDEEAAEFILHYCQSEDDGGPGVGLNSESFISMLTSSIPR